MDDRDDIVEVSVICLTYNHSSYIRDALEGFVNQRTQFRYEVIVHDDASTDDTRRIIEEYEQAYPEIIKPIYQMRNQFSQKVPIIERFVIPKVQGKYIAFCEGDDFWTDIDKLQIQYDYMESHPTCSLCVHQSTMLNQITGEESVVLKNMNEERDVCVQEILSGGAWSATNSMFFRTEFYKCQNPLAGIVPVIGDWPLSLFLFVKGEVHALPGDMSTYRAFAKGSWSVKNLDQGNKERQDFLSQLQNLLKAFDDLSDRKYHPEVQQWIDSYRFDELILDDRNYLELKKAPLRRLYDELPGTRRLGLWMKFHFPGLSSVLLKMKHRFERG